MRALATSHTPMTDTQTDYHLSLEVQRAALNTH